MAIFLPLAQEPDHHGRGRHVLRCGRKLRKLVPSCATMAIAPLISSARITGKPAMGSMDLPMLDGTPLCLQISALEVECALGAKMLDRIDEIQCRAASEQAIRL